MTRSINAIAMAIALNRTALQSFGLRMNFVKIFGTLGTEGAFLEDSRGRVARQIRYMEFEIQ